MGCKWSSIESRHKDKEDGRIQTEFNLNLVSSGFSSNCGSGFI